MKILIIRLSSLGDIILTQPVCALLHKAYPDAEITFMCKEQYASIPPLFDPPVKVMSYAKSLSFHRSLRECNFDLVIDLHAKLSSVLVSHLLSPKRRVRYEKQHLKRSRIVSGNRELAIDSTVSLYATALKKLGLPTSWQAPRLRSPQLPDNEKFSSDSPSVAIIPGATYFTKRYPTEQWIEFINSNPEWNYHLFGSGEDGKICSQILSGAKAMCHDHSGKLNLRELHQALSQCDLIISGDTGPMHLAATLSKPQIAIFGATHPSLGFKPLNPQAHILCANFPCQPCHLHGSDSCPLGHFKCMKLITPERLSSVARDLLKTN